MRPGAFSLSPNDLLPDLTGEREGTTMRAQACRTPRRVHTGLRRLCGIRKGNADVGLGRDRIGHLVLSVGRSCLCCGPLVREGQAASRIAAPRSLRNSMVGESCADPCNEAPRQSAGRSQRPESGQCANHVRKPAVGPQIVGPTIELQLGTWSLRLRCGKRSDRFRRLRRASFAPLP